MPARPNDTATTRAATSQLAAAFAHASGTRSCAAFTTILQKDMHAMNAHIRTLEEAVADVKYADRYGELNERLWRRLDTFLNLLCALGGSAAVGAVVSQGATLTATAGVVMAVAGAAQLVLRPLERAMAFRDARREILQLEAVAWTLPMNEIDARLRAIEAAAPVGFTGLEVPARNDCVRSMGHGTAVEPLNAVQRLMAALA